MFQKADCSVFSYREEQTKEYFIHEIDRVVLKPKPLTNKEERHSQKVIHKDTYEDLSIQTSLQEYKYNEKHPFSTFSELRFEFHPYKYEVEYANKRIERKYSEFLDSDEKKLIIIDCIKAVFQEIKEKSGNGKH